MAEVWRKPRIFFPGKQLCPAVLEGVIAAALQQMAGFCQE